MEENNVHVTEVQEDITIEETIDVVEVSSTEDFEIGLDEAFPAMGSRSDELNHALLNNRELPDQHPIMAITGLREELDQIESLQTVYSDKKNSADYYEWADGHMMSADEVGYFVTLAPDARTITICTDNNIFGVTVDSAAFIGGQDDIARDAHYGLVATFGAVHVRCELDVSEGDYVVSNSYGIAKKSTSNYGYRVVALHNISDIPYATIELNIPANQIEALGIELQNLDNRVDVAEKNITSAINMANQAYNKANESGEISEEALKNALEAMGKADDAIDDVDKMNETISSTNEIAVQAKAIAESAATSAESLRNEAAATANNALANVNDLIKDLEPISNWKDPETGNVGAEYLTTYIENGLATKVEVQTVETMTEENKSAILQNVESFQTMISSVDKYSVGEYSQAYGLSREQAKSILKPGMIYIPTKHSDTKVSHDEIYTDDGEVNSFTPGSYYIWTGEDWEEHSTSVVFSNQIPTPSNSLQYWYIDSNTAPEGYEPYALYIWSDEKWTRVNVLDGNITNRIVSMVRQSTDEVALEVTNARGGAASLNARIEGAESKVNSYAYWPNEANEKRFNMATIDQSADGDGSSLALAVIDKEGDNIIKGATIVLNQDDKGSYIQFDADSINFTAEDYDVIANNINLTGYVTIKGVEDGTTTINGECIKTGSIQSTNYVENSAGTQLKLSDGSWDSKNFKINSDGEITATGGKIAGWNISDEALFINIDGQCTGIYSSLESEDNQKESLVNTGGNTKWSHVRFFAGAPENGGIMDLSNANFAVLEDGSLYATLANIEGTITATKGTIGGWNVTDKQLVVNNAGFYSDNDQTMKSLVTAGESPVRLFAGALTAAGVTYLYNLKFAVLEDGSLYAKAAEIEGNITASSGKIGDFIINDGGLAVMTEVNNEEAEPGTSPEMISVATINKDGIMYLGDDMATYISNRGVEGYSGHFTKTLQVGAYDVGSTLEDLLKRVQALENSSGGGPGGDPGETEETCDICGNVNSECTCGKTTCATCGRDLITNTVECPGASCGISFEVSYCSEHGPFSVLCPDCGEHYVSVEG